MKIAIDGFALGLRQGTGLSTYSRELANTLARHGHQVEVIYGLGGIGRKESLLRPRLHQALAIRGEPEAADWRAWMPRVPLYVMAKVLGRPLQARSIPDAPTDTLARLPDGCPVFTGTHNIASLFRSAQAIGGIFGTSLRIRALPEVEIFHLSSPLPVRMDKVANVVTAHDAIPLVLPESTALNLLHYRRIMRASLCHADGIFAVSEQSKRDLVRLLDLPEERLHVTYQSVSVPEEIRHIDAETLGRFLKANFGLELGGYFLFHGAIEPKKNLMRLIDGYLMARSDLPLVVAGKDGWLCRDEVNRLNRLCADDSRRGRIRRFEYLPYWQLMYLVKGARAMVFPSLYEGFGLPVLEAMQIGTPVITSNNSSLKEIAADGAYLVDPRDIGEIAHAIDALTEDDDLHADLRAKGTARADFFSPRRHLERVEAGYRRILGVC